MMHAGILGASKSNASGPSFIYKFDSGSLTGLSEGASVTSWTNTARAIHAVGTGETAPTWSPTAFYGAGGVTFTASQYLLCSNPPAVDAQPDVVYAVVAGKSPTGNARYLFDSVSQAWERQWLFFHGTNQNVVEFGAGDSRYTNQANNTQSSVWVMRFQNGTYRLHQGGGNGWLSGSGTLPLGRLLIGASRNFVSCLDSTLGAFYVGQNHDMATINLVGAGLASTYGLPWTDVTV